MLGSYYRVGSLFWLLRQYLAFILATEGAIWSWGALWAGKKKLEIGSGPIDFWGIADDIVGSVSWNSSHPEQARSAVYKNSLRPCLAGTYWRFRYVFSVFYWTVDPTNSSRTSSYWPVMLGSFQGWGGCKHPYGTITCSPLCHLLQCDAIGLSAGE